MARRQPEVRVPFGGRGGAHTHERPENCQWATFGIGPKTNSCKRPTFSLYELDLIKQEPNSCLVIRSPPRVLISNMALVTMRELRQLMHVHYIFEISLALAYVILKYIPWAATRVFGTGDFKSSETELLIFTFIVIAINSRRRGHVNFLPYLSSACTMAKVCNFILFFYASPAYGLTYSAVLLAHTLLFPKPKYKGPENVTYFMGEEFEKELANDKKTKWLIEFYATWNPDCNEFASVFGELSAKYASKNLRFGKIDVARSPKIAEKYDIAASVTSRTLPTLILFKDGREYMRRPLFDTRDRVMPFSFAYENIATVFRLDQMTH